MEKIASLGQELYSIKSSTLGQHHRVPILVNYGFHIRDLSDIASMVLYDARHECLGIKCYSLFVLTGLPSRTRYLPPVAAILDGASTG